MAEVNELQQTSEYELVAPVGDIPTGKMKMYKVGRTQVTIANIRGNFYAFNNICLHRAGPLVEGRLLGTKVTCSWHAWVYDIPSGKVIFPKGEDKCLTTYAVKVEDGNIWVEKPKARTRNE